MHKDVTKMRRTGMIPARSDHCPSPKMDKTGIENAEGRCTAGVYLVYDVTYKAASGLISST